MVLGKSPKATGIEFVRGAIRRSPHDNDGDDNGKAKLQNSMTLILDNITATIVAGVLFLMIFAMQIRVQTNGVEETLYYEAKRATLGFASILERDLVNAGFKSTPGDSVITGYTNYLDQDSVVVTSSLVFWGIGSNGTRTRIRYTTTPTDSVMVRDGLAAAYRVERHEHTGGLWKMTGASPGTLVQFEVELLDHNDFVTSLAEARKFRIRLSNAVGGNTMRRAGSAQRVAHQLRWGITLSPAGLSQQSYQG